MKLLSKILISLLLIPLAAEAVDDQPYFENSQFTTQVYDREPVDNLKHLTTDFKDTVFYFTDLRGCVGCKMEHEWIFDDEVVYSRSTLAKHERWRWWSGKSNLEAGKWTVRVLVDDKVVISDHIVVEESTPVLMQQAPIQYRVQKQVINKCEKELAYWEKQLDEYPGEEYYEFQVFRWKNRCSESIE